MRHSRSERPAMTCGGGSSSDRPDRLSAPVCLRLARAVHRVASPSGLGVADHPGRPHPVRGHYRTDRAGKSLIYITASALTDGRTVTLTRTNGLQNKLGYDYAEMGLLDIRGPSNYGCPALH